MDVSARHKIVALEFKVLANWTEHCRTRGLIDMGVLRCPQNVAPARDAVRLRGQPEFWESRSGWGCRWR